MGALGHALHMYLQEQKVPQAGEARGMIKWTPPFKGIFYVVIHILSPGLYMLIAAREMLADIQRKTCLSASTTTNCCCQPSEFPSTVKRETCEEYQGTSGYQAHPTRRQQNLAGM